MPEELAIALVLLVIAGWIVVKLFQVLGEGLSSAHEALSRSIQGKTAKIFSWRKNKLAQNVRVFVPDELEWAENRIDVVQSEFERAQASIKWTPQLPTWVRRNFAPYALPPKSEAWNEMNVSDIQNILRPENIDWLHKESAILEQDCRYPLKPPECTLSEVKEVPEIALNIEKAVFDASRLTKSQVLRFFRREQDAVAAYNQRRTAILARCEYVNRAIKEWNIENRKRWRSYIQESKRLEEQELSAFALHRSQYERGCTEQKDNLASTLAGFRAGRSADVVRRVEHFLGSLTLPKSVPHSWEIDFDEDQRILIVEVALPDVVHRPLVKTVTLKSGPVTKPLNQTEKRESIPKVHPAILLRFAYELFRNDDAGIINLLVINGWVMFDDPHTGVNKKAYTASLMLERAQIESLNLQKLDPVAAFQGLGGKSAGRLVEIIPIEPSLSLNKKDSRFVDAKAVLNMLGSATNLAAMDWQDFEHLIRELFEKEFAGRGAEVKITQASRDRGVDAIAFDPDPIHGGKYVIQAKRYTNTVDVSAVRDLCAVVRKEGASRGILVTTSTYGADAYAFANNEPVTLLNGAELLGLLKQHGYSFRINLQEARKLNPSNWHKEKAPQTDWRL